MPFFAELCVSTPAFDEPTARLAIFALFVSAFLLVCGIASSATATNAIDKRNR